MFPATAWSFKICSKRIHRAISRAKGQRGVSPSGKGHSGGIPAFDLCFILFAVQIKISTPKVLPYAALYTELRVRLGSIKHLKWKQASPGAWVLPVCWGRDYDAINLPKAPSLTFQQQLVTFYLFTHQGHLGWGMRHLPAAKAFYPTRINGQWERDGGLWINCELLHAEWGHSWNELRLE